MSADHTSPDGVFGRLRPQAPQPFRSGSPGHHSRFIADGARLPCRARLATINTTDVVIFAATMSEPSPGPPLALPHEFYLGHAPTLRLLAA